MAGGLFAWRTFPRAFSLVSLDLRMDRPGALAAADSLARLHGWAPRERARQVALFDVDGQTQTFLELEGGGRDTLLAMATDGRFAPWTWEVRRFRPGETGETRVHFTPEGHPRGFRERLPEEAPGAALDTAAARSLADSTVGAWGLDLAQYPLLQHAREVQPAGRWDHTVVYEARDRGPGEGRLRVRVVISGDRVTEFTRFVHVPEAFTRRYALMRSANNGLAMGAMGVTLVLYGLLGVGAGLFVMMRRRLVRWREPLIAGAVIGVLQGGAIASSLPLSWFAYDTTHPVGAFVAGLVGLVLVGTVLTTLQVGISAAAAESLTRAAFPGHPQLWKLWSRESGASTAVLRRTALGYLLLGIFLAWAVGFALVSQRWRGWWSPTDLLLHPNLFATVFPWLGPIALSLQAGFWEECLFRAVPLAGAALLGDRFGRRHLWIGGAFVLQAVVFAAAHASYPAQPAYARVVELMLPSFLFGGVYLRYGLLPGVLLHFTYDLTLTSIPLFVADTPGIWLHRSIVLGAGLLPLGVVGWRRWQAGRWSELPLSLRNSASSVARAGSYRPPVPTRAEPVSPGAMRALLPLGLLGAMVWAGTATWSAPVPPLTLSRADAVELARDALAVRGGRLDPSWRTLPAVQGGTGPAHRFVWETAGDSTWRALLGDALDVPTWRVRFARFEGDVAERAEQWMVEVGPEGEPGVTRRLPEDRPGAALDEAAATRLADSVVTVLLGPGAGDLHLIGIEPTRRTARTDWEITWVDSTVPLPQGEVRVRLRLVGDDVGELNRFVHVPEAWQRAWDRSRVLRGALPTGVMVFFLLITLLTVIAGVMRWARHAFDTRSMFLTVLVMLPVGLVALVNAWPDTIARFVTTEPWGQQVAVAAIGGLLGVALFTGAAGIVVGLALPPATGARIGPAVALGCLAAGIGGLTGALAGGPPGFPAVALDAIVPALAWVDDVALGFLVRLTAILLVLHWGSRMHRRPWMATAWYVCAGSLATVAALGAGVGVVLLAWGLGAGFLVLTGRVIGGLGRRGLLVAVATWTLLTELPGGWWEDGSRWAGLAIGGVVVWWLVRGLAAPGAGTRELATEVPSGEISGLED